jgi:uncharacterized protein YpiB (UPF0302 family)
MKPTAVFYGILENSVEQEVCMTFSRDPEKYKRGLDYEVFSECITIEMAHRNALLHEAGDDTEEGRAHFETIKALKKLDESIDLQDESTFKSAWLVLDEMKAERLTGTIAKPAVA